MEKIVHEKNFEQWSVFPEVYHGNRPIPPEIIVKIIVSWLKRSPDVVIDIGCGTGLSTIIWKNIAAKIIGIEPNDDMRAIAEKYAGSGCITFMRGVSNETNLPADYADIITVSQAFHWMDIDSTLFEFYRILKTDGIVAIYDFMLPPVINWEIEKAFFQLRKKYSEIVYSQETPPVHNDKSTYNDRIKAFGKFRYSREVECHNVQRMTPQKVTEFLVSISNASFAVEIDAAYQKDVDAFCDFVKARCRDEVEIIIPYKVVIAVK